jgi:iron complex transport system ATP-binding protein
MAANDTRSSAVLEAVDLCVGYGGEPLVRDIDLQLHPGEVVTLIGPNGAGKSTILKTLAGHLAPMAGNVLLLGKQVDKMSSRDRARELAVVLTERPTTELLSCRDVVELGRYPHTGRMGRLGQEDWKAIRASMELTHVWDLRDADFSRLSDGQRQRVMLARAICQEPRIIVLDEPTSHLDVHYQIELLDMLRHLADVRRMAVVMALHELPLAHAVSDRVLCIRDGAVAFEGTPGQVFSSPTIDELFDLEPGTFDPLTGGIHLASLGHAGRRVHVGVSNEEA